MNALEVEMSLRQHLNWRQTRLIPECPVRLLRRVDYWAGREIPVYHDYYADFMGISGSGYATEFEVKISLTDWRADLKKPKWKLGFPSYISRFIYVVPFALGIPGFVPQESGIWHIRDDTNRRSSIDVVRAPKRIGKEKVPQDVLTRWMSCFYYRYWQQRIDMELPKFRDIARYKEFRYDQ